MRIEIDSVEKTVKLLDEHTNLRELLNIIDAFSAEDELDSWKILKPTNAASGIPAQPSTWTTWHNTPGSTAPAIRYSGNTVVPNVTMTTTSLGTTTTRSGLSSGNLSTRRPSRVPNSIPTEVTRTNTVNAGNSYRGRPGGITMSVAEYMESLTNTGVHPTDA